MAIPFLIAFSLLSAWMAQQDILYYVHKPKPPVEHKIAGKI